MANQGQVRRLKQGVEAWNRWRKKNPELTIDLSDAYLVGANLVGADLSGANLYTANLYTARLYNANLSGANLDSARLSDAYLYRAHLSRANLNRASLDRANLSDADLRAAKLSDANLSDANLSDADLRTVILSGANLRAANLSGANLSDANLIRADLNYADLSHAILNRAILRSANLYAVQALHTNFQAATLTGACIQDWNINSKTSLQEVTCEYIFSGSNERREFTNRRPHDPNQTFALGEFTQRYQIVLETVELFFKDGIDWKAFLASLQDLKTQSGNELNIQGIEQKASGSFVVRLEVPSETDKGAVEREMKALYQTNLAILEAKYHAELQAKDREIETHKQQSADILELAKLAASRPINVEAKAVAENHSNPETYTTTVHGNVGNYANKVQDDARQQANQYNYASPEKQSLADAAQEIQKLLKILEQTNPTASAAEQKSFVTVGTSPTVQQRAVSALQSGGKAAIEEFLDNAYVNVAVAIIEGWRDAGAS